MAGLRRVGKWLLRILIPFIIILNCEYASASIKDSAIVSLPRFSAEYVPVIDLARKGELGSNHDCLNDFIAFVESKYIDESGKPENVSVSSGQFYMRNVLQPVVSLAYPERTGDINILGRRSSEIPESKFYLCVTVEGPCFNRIRWIEQHFYVIEQDLGSFNILQCSAGIYKSPTCNPQC